MQSDEYLTRARSNTPDTKQSPYEGNEPAAGDAGEGRPPVLISIVAK